MGNALLKYVFNFKKRESDMQYQYDHIADIGSPQKAHHNRGAVA